MRLLRRIVRLDVKGFEALLRQATARTERRLERVDLVQGEAFGSLLEQVVAAFTAKVAEIFGAQEAPLFFREEDGKELWSLMPCGHGRAREVRSPIEGSAAGAGALRATKAIGSGSRGSSIRSVSSSRAGGG